MLYLAAFELIAVPVFAIFFLDTAGGLPALAGVLLLADLGLAAIGALVSSIAVNSRARDLIAPLLLLPLLVPVMIGAAGAAEPLLLAGGPSYDGFRQVDRGARSLRCRVLPRRVCGLRLPARGLTTSDRYG